MIFILTGPVRSGKTTSLQDWSANNENIDGVLCPENDEGHRFLIKMKTNEILPLEVKNTTLVKQDELIGVGPFQFLKIAFKQANEYLIQASNIQNYKYLIIDELGKLELRNMGLHTAANKVIQRHMFDINHHLILVVRSSLVESMIAHYKISKYSEIDKDGLDSLTLI